MFENAVPIKVTARAPPTPEADLKAKWARTLQYLSQTHHPRVQRIKEGDQDRLFYALKVTTDVQPLQTTVSSITLRDDLEVFKVTLISRLDGPSGQTAVQTTVNPTNLKAEGLDPNVVFQLVNAVISDDIAGTERLQQEVKK